MSNKKDVIVDEISRNGDQDNGSHNNNGNSNDDGELFLIKDTLEYNSSKPNFVKEDEEGTTTTTTTNQDIGNKNESFNLNQKDHVSKDEILNKQGVSMINIESKSQTKETAKEQKKKGIIQYCSFKHLYTSVLASLSTGFVLGMYNYSFGLFVPALSSEFPTWTRTQINGAFSSGQVTSNIIAPFLGHLIDMYGPRIIVTISLLFSAQRWQLMV